MISYSTPVARLVSGAILAMALTSPAKAANFEFSRFLEIGATGTDNPELESDPDDSELVLSVNPSVELRFTGNRFGTIVVGEVEYFRFTSAEDDIIDPRLFARTRGTLIDGSLFLDGTVTIANLSQDVDFIRLSEDDDSAAEIEGRLFIDRSFGEFADLYAAYTNETFFASIDESLTSQRDILEFNIGRSPELGGILWGLGAFYDNDESDDDLFENTNAFASLGVAVSKTFIAEVTYGMEDRQLTEALNTNPVVIEDEDDTFWQASFTWNPSERTSLKAGYGERFFGFGPSLSFNHRTENSNIFATFSRDISRNTTTLNGISALTGTTGTSLPSDTDSVTIDNGTIAAQLDEPFVDNRFQVGYKLTGRRSDLIIDAIYSQQDPLTGGDSIDTWLGRLIFDRKLSELTTLRLQYDYRRSDAQNREGLNFDENRIGVKFIFNFDKVDRSSEEAVK